MFGEWGGLTGVWRSPSKTFWSRYPFRLVFWEPSLLLYSFQGLLVDYLWDNWVCFLCPFIYSFSRLLFVFSMHFAFDCLVPVHTSHLETPLSVRTVEVSFHIYLFLSPSRSVFWGVLVSIRLSSAVNTWLIRKSSYLAECNAFSSITVVIFNTLHQFPKRHERSYLYYFPS